MAGTMVGRRTAAAAVVVLGSLIGTALAPLSPAGAAARPTGAAQAAKAAVGSLLTTLKDPLKNGADGFGLTVAVSGATAVVGTDDEPASPHPGGAAYIYRRGPSGWATTPAVSLSDPGATGADAFSNALAVSGSTVVIGANGPSAGGRAYIYTEGPSGWPTTPTVTLTDPLAMNGDGFGDNLAVSGHTLAVGAEGNGGAVYIYTRGRSGWPTTPTVTIDNPGDSTEQFGDVSLSGSTLVVGAVGAGTIDSGEAYIYRKSASGWPTTPTVTLTDPGPDISDVYAGTVAVSGTDVLVAAWGTTLRAGDVYIYAKGTSGWSTTPSATLDDPAATAQDEFGADVAASGTTLVVGTAGPDAGGDTDIFAKGTSGRVTTPTATVANPAGIQYGYTSIPAVSGTTLVVGLSGEGGGLVDIYQA
jgi:hypothetical protein